MDIPSKEEILASVAAFRARHGMAETRFGRDATGEPQLIKSIEDGRSPSHDVLLRMQEFMRRKDAELEAEEAAAAAPQEDAA